MSKLRSLVMLLLFCLFSVLPMAVLAGEGCFLYLGTMNPIHFEACSGLGSENDVIEQKVIDSNGKEIVKKIPGRLRYDDILLQRGITSNLELWDWRQQIVDGGYPDAAMDGTIVVYDKKAQEVARWQFANAWPSKLTSPSITSSDRGYGVEEITLVHEGILRTN